jgi:Zn-dependent protease
LLVGWAAYTNILSIRVTILLFVVSGWLISLSLHEYGHALVAFIGGDTAVREKGYLTLNPLKYTHVLYSIVLPLLYLAIGGIGLPGAAVYINKHRIIKKHMRSLTSAGGPIATLLLAFFLSMPFILNWPRFENEGQLVFWVGFSLLLYLQITALLFNLLPIPGLDGFGILEPYIPKKMVRKVTPLYGYAYIIIIILFVTDNPVRSMFWNVITLLTSRVGIEVGYVYYGLEIFQSWFR